MEHERGARERLQHRSAETSPAASQSAPAPMPRKSHRPFAAGQEAEGRLAGDLAAVGLAVARADDEAIERASTGVSSRMKTVLRATRSASRSNATLCRVGDVVQHEVQHRDVEARVREGQVEGRRTARKNVRVRRTSTKASTAISPPQRRQSSSATQPSPQPMSSTDASGARCGNTSDTVCEVSFRTVGEGPAGSYAETAGRALQPPWQVCLQTGGNELRALVPGVGGRGHHVVARKPQRERGAVLARSSRRRSCRRGRARSAGRCRGRAPAPAASDRGAPRRNGSNSTGMQLRGDRRPVVVHLQRRRRCPCPSIATVHGGPRLAVARSRCVTRFEMVCDIRARIPFAVRIAVHLAARSRVRPGDAHLVDAPRAISPRSAGTRETGPCP